MPTHSKLVSKIMCSRGRSPSGGGWVMACAFLVAWMASGLSVAAAGCHFSALKAIELHAGGQPGKLAENAWWSTAKVRCVYESGRLSYFQVPTDSLPCNGPGCRGKSPENQMQVPVVIETERQSFFGVVPLRLSHCLCPLMAFVAFEGARPTSPVLSELLRPPRL